MQLVAEGEIFFNCFRNFLGVEMAEPVIKTKVESCFTVQMSLQTIKNYSEDPTLSDPVVIEEIKYPAKIIKPVFFKKEKSNK